MSEDIEPAATRDGPASLPPGTAVHKIRRQRRPTGAPPPLPHPITISTTAWLILGADLRYYTFPGGCVTYDFRFKPGASPVLAVAVDSALAFQPRSTLVDYIRHTEGLALCGRGAACPG